MIGPACSVPGCDRPRSSGRGLCQAHETRLRRTGSLLNRFGDAKIFWSASTHGMRDTPTYQTWIEMRRRCRGRKGKTEYVENGIKVCSRWNRSFEAFLADMGERPEGTTLDRWPDQQGNYEPGNCRWATPKEQSRNRKSNLSVEWEGRAMAFSEFCELTGIDRFRAHHLYTHKGMPLSKIVAALSTSPHQPCRRKAAA